MHFSKVSWAAKLLCSASLVMLYGCANYKPEPIGNLDIAAQAQALKNQQAKDIDPITGTLTLEEAIARAINSISISIRH